MRYLQHIDPNSYVIEEGIKQFKRVNVNLGVALNNYVVDVPEGAYGVMIRKAPIDVEIKINDSDYIPVYEAENFSPWIDGINEFLVKTTSTSANPLVLVFII